MLDRERYLQDQKRLLELAREVRELDIEGMLEAIGTAEAFAPMLDPTGYRHGAKNLGIIKRLALGALEFQRAYPDYEAVVAGALDVEGYLGVVRAGGSVRDITGGGMRDGGGEAPR